jgi:ribosomal protein S20
MANNIRTQIKEIVKDIRQTDETKKQAKELVAFVGTNKPIHKKLKKNILENKSPSDAVSTMRQYTKNKK